MQLTSDWEANLGLAGGDRDPRCEVTRWLGGAEEVFFFSCQNPINQQVGHLWQRATATPLGQTAAKPTGFQTQRGETQTGSGWRLYCRRNRDVGTADHTLGGLEVLTLQKQTSSTETTPLCFLLAQEAVETMK